MSTDAETPPTPTHVEPFRHGDVATSAALAANAGWQVRPLVRGDRLPAYRDAHALSRLDKAAKVIGLAEDVATDPALVDWHSGRRADFGLVTGRRTDDDPSAPVPIVLDVDDPAVGGASLDALLAEAGPEAQAWAAETLRVTTGKGWHLYGTVPAADAPRRVIGLAPALDLLGNAAGSGGWVALPGCTHPTALDEDGHRRLYRVDDAPERVEANLAHPDDEHAVRLAAVWPDDFEVGREMRALPMPESLLDVLTGRAAAEAVADFNVTHVEGDAPADARAAQSASQRRSRGAEDFEPSHTADHATKRLDGIVRRMAQAEPGKRNDTLNPTAYLAARIIASLPEGERQHIDAADVRERLHEAAASAWEGQDQRGEIDATLASGWGAGLRDAVPVEADEPVPEVVAGEDGTYVVEVDAEPGSSWQPHDLSDLVHGLADGSYEPPRPSVLDREDGAALLYAERVNVLYGPSGEGKTWTALVAVAQVLADGGRVLYIDLDGSEADTVTRLLALGIDPATIVDGLDYLAPDEPLTSAQARQQVEALLDAGGHRLAIVDADADWHALHGLDALDTSDARDGYAHLRWIANRDGGPALLVVDHVPKDRDLSRGPIGAQSAVAKVDGTVVGIKSVRGGFVPGEEGSCDLVVFKDRSGGLAARKHATVARIVLDSTSTEPVAPGSEVTRVAARVEGPPGASEAIGDAVGEVRDAVVAFLPGPDDEPVSTTEVVKGVKGDDSAVRATLGKLVDDGEVEQTDGARNAKLHRLARSE